MLRVIHNALLHRADFAVEIPDLVIGLDVELDHVVLGEGLSLLGKAGSRVRELPQGPHGGALQNAHARINRHNQQQRHKDEAVGQKGASLLHDVRHVQIGPGHRHDLPAHPIPHRLQHRAQPPEIRAVDGGRHRDVPRISRKFRDGRFDGADIKQVFIEIGNVIGHKPVIVLVVGRIRVEILLDGEKAGQNFLIVRHEAVVPPVVFREAYQRFAALPLLHLQRMPGISGLLPEPVRDQILIVLLHGPLTKSAKLIRVDLIPEILHKIPVEVVGRRLRSVLEIQEKAIVYPLAEDIIADRHEAHRHGKDAADDQDGELFPDGEPAGQALLLCFFHRLKSSFGSSGHSSHPGIHSARRP